MYDLLGCSPPPAARVHIRQCIKRIQKQSRVPRYPFFYSIEPLLAYAFKDGPFELPRYLLLLRMTTLMRTCDVGNIAWALWQHEGAYYIRTTDKMGTPRMFVLQGRVLTQTIQYMHTHLMHPNPLLIRYQRRPELPLGRERIANLVLEVMRQCGLDTTVFKAHSIRGAVATTLLSKGVAPSLVQQRGGWARSCTLDEFYNRLHHQKNWESLLLSQESAGTPGEHAGVQASASSAAAGPKVPGASSTQEEESPGTEGRPDALLGDLAARGVLRDATSHSECPCCSFPMRHEAAYACTECNKVSHVRCLATAPQSTAACTIYLPICFICNVRKPTPPPSPPRARSSRDLGPSGVIDVMGVL